MAGAFSSLVARNRRRYGGYIVHVSIVLLAIGIVGSSAYDTISDAQLRPGQSMSVAGYDLRYRVEESRGANAQEIRAVVDVSRDGEQLGTLRPGKNRYFAEQQVSNEAAIRSDPLNGEDLSSLPTRSTATRSSSGAREAARQPDLDRRLRLPRRRCDRPLA